MAKYSIDDSTLVAIGNAIREKNGTTEPMSPSEMIDAISALKLDGGGASSNEALDSMITRQIEVVESEALYVEKNTFYSCSQLIRATLPYAEYIGDNGFRECTRLVDLSIPNVLTLQSSSFRGCSKLEKVDLPKVNKIYASVFQSCTVLRTLILRSGTVCTMSNITALTSTPIDSGTGYIYVPSALVEEYKAATNWRDYADQIRAIEDYPEITGN